MGTGKSGDGQAIVVSVPMHVAFPAQTGALSRIYITLRALTFCSGGYCQVEEGYDKVEHYEHAIP